MADEQASVSTASRPTAKGAIPKKAHGKCKAKIREIFAIRVVRAIPRSARQYAKEKPLTTNPSQPPLIIMGGVKTRLQAFESGLCLETNPGMVE